MPPPSVGIFNSDFVPDELPPTKAHLLKEDPRSINLDDALELIGLGRAQLEIVALCGLVIVATICETMGISVVLPAAKCDLALTTGNQGLLSGATFLGITATSYVWGYLSDTRGRRKMMRYGLFASVVCAVLSGFANDLVSLLVLRLIAGVCISAPSATVFAYLGEFCKPSKRAQIVSCGSIGAMLAMGYIGLIGWWILSYDWSVEITPNYLIKPWRLLFLLYSVPGLLAALAFHLIPESPKFYAAIGRTDRAMEVLQYCYRKNKGSLVGFDHYCLKPERSSADHKLGLLGSLWQQTVPLLRWPLVLYFVVCCLQQISAFAVYGGLGLWYPELMNQVMFAGRDMSVCSAVENVRIAKATRNVTESSSVCIAEVHSQTFISMLILAGFGTVGGVIISVLLGKIDRKIMTGINFLIPAAAGIALLFVSSRYAIVLLFCTEIFLSGYSMVLVNGSAVSIFPTNVRAMAVSLSMMMARLSSFMFSSLVGFVIEENCEATFYMFSGLLVVGASLTVFIP